MIRRPVPTANSIRVTALLIVKPDGHWLASCRVSFVPAMAIAMSWRQTKGAGFATTPMLASNEVRMTHHAIPGCFGSSRMWNGGAPTEAI